MKKRSAKKILIPLTALLIFGIVVLMERYGVINKYMDVEAADRESLVFTPEVRGEADCLVLTCGMYEEDAVFEELIYFVLDEMCVPYDVQKVTDDTVLNELDKYRTLVLAFSDWSMLGDNLLVLCDWVRAGGRMMNLSTPIPNTAFFAVAGKLGIAGGGDDYVSVSGFQVMNEAMIGGIEGDVYSYVTEGEEPLDISLNVMLREECEVLLASEDGSVPLLWRCEYGEGVFTIFNESVYGKSQRGFLSLAYSTLEDMCIYPVINASAFYLDDFPSPVPGGNGEYIKRDYGVSTSTFYSTIWWPSVLEWADKYGIRYTGLIIEEYSDDVEAPFEANTDISQFLTYGNMLLNAGGELGFHGYNHMPLCIEGIDEEMRYGEYKLWKSAEEMKSALAELKRFSEELFPQSTFSVYVPPSNILSETGRSALREACPDIRMIASFYIPSDDAKEYIQEFEVAADGMIETPRVVSGLALSDYQRIAALSELNFHYVQSHFMHPDDLLDEDRGAATGFEELASCFENYLEWVYSSAPNIRNVTGSGMGTAVLQYDKLSIKREQNGSTLNIKLGGYSGEAYFLLRINEGTFAKIEGGTCEPVTGNLYVVHAEDDTIKIITQ